MKTVTLFQGKKEWLQFDTIVINMITNSCALVVVFIEGYKEVLCYHWPGFHVDDDTILNFKSECPLDYAVKNLVVITNGFAYEGEKQEQINKVNKLKQEIRSEEAHYFASNQVNATPIITITSEGNYTIPDSFEEINL